MGSSQQQLTDLRAQAEALNQSKAALIAAEGHAQQALNDAFNAYASDASATNADAATACKAELTQARQRSYACVESMKLLARQISQLELEVAAERAVRRDEQIAIRRTELEAEEAQLREQVMPLVTRWLAVRNIVAADAHIESLSPHVFFTFPIKQDAMALRDSLYKELES